MGHGEFFVSVATKAGPVLQHPVNPINACSGAAGAMIAMLACFAATFLHRLTTPTLTQQLKYPPAL